MAPRRPKETPAADAGGGRAREKAAAPAGRARERKAADPHRLVKRDDGYASADGRFEVSGSAGSWYLADAKRPNPLGLPTIEGPFRTLGEVRAAIAAEAGS